MPVDEHRDDDPAFIPKERMKFYQQLLALYRANGNKEIADAFDRVLFAPITDR